MTAPAIHAAGLRTADIETQFQRQQNKMRQRNQGDMNTFIQRGIHYYAFRKVLERRNATLPLDSAERLSFWQWLQDADNRVGSPQAASLSAQTIGLFRVYFHIPLTLLTSLGVAKYGVINPEVELHKARVEKHYARYMRAVDLKARYLARLETDIDVYRRFDSLISRLEVKHNTAWLEARMMALWWIHTAQPLSVSQLNLEMLSRSIQYTGQTTANQATARHTGTYDTILDNVPMRVGDLWQMTKEELLSWLGAAQMQDDEYLYTRTSRPKPKD